MNLNKKQQEIYDLVISKKHKVVLLEGKAGTGKSYVLSKIATAYNGDVLVTATTNKAKNLLAQAIGITTYTTHSALGFTMLRKGTTEYLADINEPMNADLLIIDEASMLPSEVYHKALMAGYEQILLVGDSSQLLSIGMKANIVPEASVTLSEQMRQSSSPRLDAYLDNIRQGIFTKKSHNLLVDVPEEIIFYEKFKDFAKAYINCTKEKRILAYSNRCVDSYNASINGTKFKLGDQLVLDKPLGKFKNSDTVEIISIDEDSKVYSVTLALDKYKESAYIFKTKGLEEDFLDEVLKHYPDKYWAYKDKIIHPKHIYASTVHKAQGSSIDEVFIDLTDIQAQTTKKPSVYNNYNQPMSISEYLRLVYVAISRMRYKAHIYIGDKRDYKCFKS